jgi:hypothetical protein
MFPSRLPQGDFTTEHPGIVTCDRRKPCCPGCHGEAGYIWMSTEQANEFSAVSRITVMKVDPCAHRFTVHIGLDMKIRLEELGT